MEPIDINIKFDNHSNFVYYSDGLPIFQDEFIPTINKKHHSKSKFFFTLKILLLNSSSKVVYNLIRLILLLNELQYLIIKDILDYAIKNKRKIFFDLNQQLLLYIRDERVIGKSRVMSIIQISFFYLAKKKS